VTTFDRDDIPLPTPLDTLREILADGIPRTDDAMRATAETMGRPMDWRKVRAARAELVRRGEVMPAAGYSKVVGWGGRCVHRYVLVPSVMLHDKKTPRVEIEILKGPTP
jgi:hypothetical protein